MSVKMIVKFEKEVFDEMESVICVTNKQEVSQNLYDAYFKVVTKNDFILKARLNSQAYPLSPVLFFIENREDIKAWLEGFIAYRFQGNGSLLDFLMKNFNEKGFYPNIDCIAKTIHGDTSANPNFDRIATLLTEMVGDSLTNLYKGFYKHTKYRIKEAYCYPKAN